MRFFFFKFNKHDVVFQFRGKNPQNLLGQISAAEGCHRSGIFCRKSSLIFTDRICPRKPDAEWIKYSGNIAGLMEMDSRGPVWPIQEDCILHYMLSFIYFVYNSQGYEKCLQSQCILHHTTRIKLFRLTFAILCNGIGGKLSVPLPDPPLFVFFSKLLCPKTLKSPQKQEPLQRWDHGFPERRSQMDEIPGRPTRFRFSCF